MKYTVTWTTAAEQDLAAAWMASTQRGAVNRAAFAIDQQLERDPLQAGESRANGRRIIIESPRVAIFRVYPAQTAVRVLQVWDSQRGKKS